MSNNLSSLQSIYSDMYKDVHGFRPRGCDPELWESEEKLRKALDELQEDLKKILAWEAEDEKNCIERFEKLIVKTMNEGAKDRETAIIWLMEAEHTDADKEYFCFLNGLPTNYLN
jgi:hypothetical protein